MAWGRPRSCTCGACQKCKNADYMREWYRSKSPEERRRMREGRNLELVRKRDTARHHKQKHELEYATKRWAQSCVRNAVKGGRLERGPCERCGSTERVHGHHDDYSKPLEVRWLCSQCHADEHTQEEAA